MQLRSRPAALSERRAIFAPDPTHLSTLALKDAERATQLKPTWHKGYSRQVGRMRSCPSAARMLPATRPAAQTLPQPWRSSRLPPSTAPKIRTPQGAALFLLERYSEAETAYLEGLVLAPGNAVLTDGLKKVGGVAWWGGASGPAGLVS
jgi:hypothetical protein